MESNSDKKLNVNFLKKGIREVHEGNLHQADISFETEEKQSIMDYDVYYHHGHLLNRLGQYNGAIDKFNAFLNINEGDVSCLFGKGISNLGLLKLDKALYLFKQVIDKCPSHADAYFYSAIIFNVPFSQRYNPGCAKKYYENYQDLREEFFKNNPDYYGQLDDDLSLEEYYEKIHNFYNLSDLFILINQLLEKECVSDSNEFTFKEFKLLNDDKKEVEDKFKIVGYDENLINDLSSKYNGLDIDKIRTLNKIADYFKNSDLYFSALQDLIREKVIAGDMDIDSFYEKRENISKSHIEGTIRALDRLEEKNEELNNKYNDLQKSFDDLFEKYNNLEEALKNKEEELTNQLENRGADKSDNESVGYNLSSFRAVFKNANSLNMISGINYEDYKIDLEVLVSKGNIPEEQCNIFKSAFEEYNAGNFKEASENFKKLSGKSGWPREYIDFLIATSLSSNGNVEAALKIIDRCQTSTELGEKYIKGKYPIRWFNYGNIFLDYANSQSNDDGVKKYYTFAIYCYQRVKESISSKSKSNFNFNDNKTKEGFENNFKEMLIVANICKGLFDYEVLKHNK